MAAILLASACPAVQVFTSSVYLLDQMNTAALVAKNIPAATTWRKQANQDAAMLDQTARYGAGLIGIPDGPTKITLAVGTGLSLAVSAGHAMIGGPVEIPTATTLAVPDNTARVWIWLRRTAALAYTTTTTPPSGESCLLGSCVTASGSISSVDTSGVVYLRGGIGLRQTADALAPSDTPSSTIQFMAQTVGGNYMWTGTQYVLMGVPINTVDPAIIADGTTDMADIITASLATLASAGGGIRTLPAGTIKLTKAFTWPTHSNITLVGQGLGATTLDASTSTTGAIVYSAATRITYGTIAEMTIHGPGTAGGTGVDLADWDRGIIRNCRIYNWNNCLKITSTGTRGALHNRIEGCIITNATVNNIWLTGAQGPHETMIIHGECSIGGTGLMIDSPTDACRVIGTSFESNTQAIDCSGSACEFDVRLEGNTADVIFQSTAYYNILRTAFFNPAKHVDSATGAGIGTNRVIPWGFSTSATERVAPFYVPGDPMAFPLTSQVPGSTNSICHLFHVDNVRKVSTVTIVVSVQSGNVDVAICNAGGTILASSGSTAVGTANAKQDIALTSAVFLGPGRDYYVAIIFDNGTAGYFGILGTSAGYNLMQNEIGARLKSLTFPFASQNPVSGGSFSAIVPFVRLG